MDSGTGETIRLRTPRPADVNAVHEATEETLEDLIRWMPWATENLTREDSARWIDSREAARDAGTEFDFLIVSSKDRILGICGLHRIDWVNATAELGYWVRLSARNRGVATCAIGKLVDVAFTDLSLHRLEMIIATTNLPSQRTALRAGARNEARLTSRINPNGTREDAFVFAILADQST